MNHFSARFKDQNIVFPHTFNNGELWWLIWWTFCQLSISLLLPKIERSFKNISLFVYAHSLPMPHIFEPLTCIFTVRGNFLPLPVSHSLEPSPIIYVVFVFSFWAKSSLPMSFIIQIWTSIRHARLSIVVETMTSFFDFI